jgi:hypothetical protein
MNMKNTDKLHISGLDTLIDGVENITFSEFISDMPHDNFLVSRWGSYNKYITKKDIINHGQKSNLERSTLSDL